MAGVLRIITQAVLTATPRKRPPLGLLVIAKLTLQFFFIKNCPKFRAVFTLVMVLSNKVTYLIYCNFALVNTHVVLVFFSSSFAYFSCASSSLRN